MDSPSQIISDDPILSTTDSDMIMQLLVWRNPESSALLITSLIDWALQEELICIKDGKLKFTAHAESKE